MIKLAEGMKTKIEKGSRVLVKTRKHNYSSWKIKEGKVIDAQKDCLKIEFSWWFFKWSKWLPINENLVRVEFQALNG